MKRNVLKKTLSEDLTWADFLKNETHYGAGLPSTSGLIGPQARSLYSTPERKADITSDHDKDEQA